VGTADGEDVFVVGGLEAGERVAAIGAFKLLDGLLTHVAESREDIAPSPATPGKKAQVGESGP
jgi:hypothetical protein